MKTALYVSADSMPGQRSEEEEMSFSIPLIMTLQLYLNPLGSSIPSLFPGCFLIKGGQLLAQNGRTLWLRIATLPVTQSAS